MAMLLNKNSKMGSPLLHEFKRQASFFFKEKIKTARLALTDVTPTELLTEEIINGDLWAPDTRAMGVISRAAFEVDDYCRIVDILHKRLIKFDRKNWRVSYKTLLLLEHLLTHGPLRVADEFQCDKDAIKEMASFQFVDEKGFNWGSSVRKLSERILELLQNEQFLKEERASARKLTREIQGFGSFSQRSSSAEESLKALGFRTRLRCNSIYTHQHNQEKDDEFMDSKGKLLHEERIQIHENTSHPALGNQENISREEYTAEDHPFCDNHHHTAVSLLSEAE
ncbi:clathrin interactor 1-like [Populus alba x Populus x berolinensis]|nr:clathrin interactor 1-like [Populus alba x Populus x berolinensis]